MQPDCDKGIGPKIISWEDGHLRLSVTPLRELGNTLEISATSEFDRIGIASSPVQVFGAIGGAKRRSMVFQPGDFSLSPKGQEVFSQVERPGATLSIEFDNSYRAKFQDITPGTSFLDEPVNVANGLVNAQAHLAMINDFVRSDGLGGALRAECLLLLLLGDVFRTLHAPCVETGCCVLDDQAISDLTEFIDASLQDKITVTDLASHCGVSPFHFSRMFKATTGLSPHQFVIRHRLDKARALLQDTRVSVAEIAYMVGFSSQSHMSTSFQKQFKISPAKYRKTLMSAGSR